MATQPDITAPVSRTRASSIGTIMNYGTAVNSTNGGANSTVGGSANNGVASFQNTAKNPITLNRDTNLGGATKESLVSSQNPASIQLDSTNDRQSQYVARTAQNLISSTAGYHVDFPTAANVANQQPNSRSGPSYVLEGKTYPNSIAKVGPGLQNSNVYGGDQSNLGALRNDFAEDLADPVHKRVDGKKGVGDPTPQVRNSATEDLTSTNFVDNVGANPVTGLLAGQYSGVDSN